MKKDPHVVDTGRYCPVFFDLKTQQREQLERDVESYLRSGGVIHQLAPSKRQGRLSMKRLEVVWGIVQQVG